MKITKFNDCWVENLQNEDTDEVISVILRAFKMDPQFKGPYSLLKYKCKTSNDFLVLKKKVKGEIIGGVGIFRFSFHFPPLIIQGAGLGYVAIEPKHHKKGYGQKLMQGVIDYLEKTNTEVCFLYTGSPSFYSKKGWVMGFNNFSHKSDSELFRQNIGKKIKKKSINTSSFSFRKYRPQDFNVIKDIHNEFNKNYYGIIVRQDWYWNNLKLMKFSPLNSFYVIFRDNSIIAYFKINKGHRENLDRLILSEYGISSIIIEKFAEIEDFILQCLSNLSHELGFQEVGIILPQIFAIVHKFHNLGGKDVSGWLSGEMINIIRLDLLLPKIQKFQEDILSKMDKNTKKTIANSFNGEILILSINKMQLQYVIGKNQEIIISNSIEEKKIYSLKKENKKSEQMAIIIKISNKLLARILFGNLSVSEAVENEIFTINEKYLSLLDAIFPVLEMHNYSLDGF